MRKVTVFLGPLGKKLMSGMVLSILPFFLGGVSQSFSATPQEETVDQAKTTLERFHANPDLEWFSTHVQEAKAVLVIPGYFKGAFFFGAGGGNGVLLVQDQHSLQWSEPAFYSVGDLSFGLQIGAHVMESVIMVMTDKAVDAFMTTEFKVGGGMSATIGPSGGQMASTPSSDLIVFSQAKGAMVGLSIAGAVIAVHEDYNKAYYGKEVSPKDITQNYKVKNPQSVGLRAAVTQVGYQSPLEFFPTR